MLKDLMLKSVIIAFACSTSFAAYGDGGFAEAVNVPAGDLVRGLSRSPSRPMSNSSTKHRS